MFLFAKGIKKIGDVEFLEDILIDCASTVLSYLLHGCGVFRIGILVHCVNSKW